MYCHTFPEHLGGLPLKPQYESEMIFTREREKVIQIRVSEQEKKRIMQNAKKCKMSISSYVRELANGYTPKAYPQHLIDLCKDIEFLIEWNYPKPDPKFNVYLENMLNDVRSKIFKELE